jgi:tellurite resistance protein
MTSTRPTAFVEHLSPALFVPVMGWAGLGLSWARASQGLGETAHLVALLCALLASSLLGLVGLCMVWRWIHHPQALLADTRHPVKQSFWSALPIGMVLLAALWISLEHINHWAMNVFWWIGALGEWATTLWVLTRWLRPADDGGTPMTALTPIIFLPLIGNVLVPWAGVPLDHATWSGVQMGIGLFMWPVALTLLLVRQFQVGPLPARMTPTWFILVVPPSAGALSLSLFQPHPTLLWALWGIGLFSLMWALTQLKIITNIQFDLPHWGMSFPLASFTSLTLMMAQQPDGNWLWLPGMALLAITSVVMLWLSRMTWRGLWRGELLRPE